MIPVLLVSCCASARYLMPAMVPMAPVPHPMGFAPSPMAHHLPVPVMMIAHPSMAPPRAPQRRSGPSARPAPHPPSGKPKPKREARRRRRTRKKQLMAAGCEALQKAHEERQLWLQHQHRGAEEQSVGVADAVQNCTLEPSSPLLLIWIYLHRIDIN